MNTTPGILFGTRTAGVLWRQRTHQRIAIISYLYAALFFIEVNPARSEFAAGPADLGATPQLLLLNGEQLALAKSRFLAGEPAAVEAVKQLETAAESAMAAPMRSVIDKPLAPPSGDLRDYVSLSPYFWPNPNTEDGLPYVRRDGEINPERRDYDVGKLEDFGRAVKWAGLAYYFTDDERYAQHAVERLSHFLLDPQTRMNPHMAYAQFVPGQSEGRCYGIIETLRLRYTLDAIILLRSSPALDEATYLEIQEWFKEYLDWMKTSRLGQEARDTLNNHGTWYAAQVATYSAFVDDWEGVKLICDAVPDMIAQQIEPDGHQPHEIKRTRALDYSEFNLRGFSDLATIAKRVDIDLWHFSTEDGRSIRQGYAFLRPYLANEKDWPYQQISPPKDHNYLESLRRAAIIYGDPLFEESITRLKNPGSARPIYLELMLPLP